MRKEYWVNKGFTESEAVEKIKALCNTVSYDAFVNRYGAIEGRTKYIEYCENKRNFSIQNDTVLRIFNSNMATGHAVSKMEIKIREYFKYKGINFIPSFSLKIKDKLYIVYFYLPDINFVIEYFGDFWHANPKIFNKDDVVYFGKSANKIWEHDKIRLNDIRSFLKCNTKIIWESDLKQKFTMKMNNLIETLGPNIENSINTKN